MPKSTLFIPELEYALRYWEERNQIAESLFQLTQKGKKIDESAYKKPLHGSELDNQGNLRKAIKDFKNLRTCLEKKISFCPIEFLPNVPWSKKKVYSKLNFVRRDIIRNIASFPYFLGEWLQYKKTYILQGSGIIPVVSPQENNFFLTAPHDSFIIKFEQPISFNLGNNSMEHKVIIVVLNKTEDVLDILPLPTIIEEILLNEREKLLLSKKGQIPEIRFLKEMPMFGVTVNLYNGEIISEIVFEHIRKNEYQEVFYDGELIVENTKLKNFCDTIIGTVNGFCKILSELKPQSYTLEVIDNKELSTPKITEEYDWNTVPVTQIRNLGHTGYEMHISLSIKRGNEKSPHWRRGHWRKVVHNDGTSERIWIEQTLIREDKLNEEGLKGSATLIKESKTLEVPNC